MVVAAVHVGAVAAVAALTLLAVTLTTLAVLTAVTLTVTLPLTLAVLPLLPATLVAGTGVLRPARLPRTVRRPRGRRRERVVPLIALGRAQHDVNTAAAHDVMRHPLGLDSSDVPGCRLLFAPYRPARPVHRALVFWQTLPPARSPVPRGPSGVPVSLLTVGGLVGFPGIRAAPASYDPPKTIAHEAHASQTRAEP